MPYDESADGTGGTDPTDRAERSVSSESPSHPSSASLAIGLPAVVDLLAGAAVFLLLLALMGHLPDLLSPTRASAMSLEGAALIAHGASTIAALPPQHAAPPAAGPAVLAALGLTFSVLFAFNAAILRHLRRAYASPRRDGWGGGR